MTLSELSEKYEVTSSMISKWKKEFLQNASVVFTEKRNDELRNKKEQKLYAKIGKLEIYN